MIGARSNAGSFNGAAAVRPRKAWPRTGDARSRAARLQWGRGGEAAESAGSRAGQRLIDVLQWGRGGEAAESQPAVAADAAGLSCFNGAAAVRPRKGQPLADRRPATGQASMGPRR